jgi:uncharacterized repeat protein (TIGR03803 family)
VAACLGTLPGAALAADAADAAPPPVFGTVHVFQAADAAVPRQPIQASDGNLYGTTATGGAFGGGILYRMTPDRVVTRLHDFAATADDARAPAGKLVEASDGMLYGVTGVGGTAGVGTVYRIGLDGSGYQVLHSFTENPDAGYPLSGLVQASDGNLYGTSYSGGSESWGAIYRITLDGDYAVFHSFQGSDGHFSNAELIQGSDGLLYGTTRTGGTGRHGHGAQGTAFSISLAGEFTTLHSFTGPDGLQPMAPLFQARNGMFYGTTQAGGAHGAGNVFRMTPQGHVTSVHDFGSSADDGLYPQAGVIDPGDGNLYGTAEMGGTGTNCQGFGCGVVYRLAPDGTETILHEFGLGDEPGWLPFAGLTALSGHRLVGVAGGNSRGSPVGGTIFGLRPARP